MSKKVFFLGAGFSKAINQNYPLLKNLTDNVNEKLSKASNFYHYQELSDDIKSNVEALLTYLSTDFPWKTDVTKYANLSLYHDITKIISDEFKYLAKRHTETQYSEIWNQFAEFIATNSDTYSFITLNYDLLLEDLLKVKMQNIYKNKYIDYEDFYKYPIAKIQSRLSSSPSGWASAQMYNKPNAPSILKLHGSANWFWAGINPSDTIYYRSWQSNENDTLEQGLKPYIIPPVMDKNIFYNHIAIRSLWQQAEKLLKEAEEIYIIGFSFPPTDLSVRYLFQSAQREHTAKVYVINPDTEKELRKNYDLVFGKNNAQIDYTYTGGEQQDYDVTEKFIRGALMSPDIIEHTGDD